MVKEVEKLYNILVEILGESKSGYDDSTFQYQFPCPHCVEKYGKNEERKYNLECNTALGYFNCWKCSSEGDNMHGSILKLIKMYGNEALLSEYRETIKSIRDSELYKLHFKNNEFSLESNIIEKEELKFPESFNFFKKGKPYYQPAFDYLKERGIGWDIIEKYKIGYTAYEKEDKKSSYRIIIPSYDAFGDINYWVARDYLPDSKYRMKYNNPKTEKKDIIFNEEKVQWDADITLVEGPFDHIVVPNSIPLLGKSLNTGYKLYWEILEKCNGAVNIFLDADAKTTAYEIYRLLNHGRLYGKIRYIPVEGDEDPSSLYQNGGYKAICEHLARAEEIGEIYLGNYLFAKG